MSDKEKEAHDKWYSFYCTMHTHWDLWEKTLDEMEKAALNDLPLDTNKFRRVAKDKAAAIKAQEKAWWEYKQVKRGKK